MEALRPAVVRTPYRAVETPDAVDSLTVPVLLFGAMAALAGAFYLGGAARVASAVNLPGEATSASTFAIRLSAALAVAAGLAAIAKTRRGVPIGYGVTVLLLSAVVATSEIGLWSNVRLADLSPTITGTAVLLTFPAAWRAATDRQILFGMSPLIALSALSIIDHVMRGAYLFPWYNRWGLIGALISAGAIALTDLGLRTRAALFLIGVGSVMFSTSRQALLGLLLALGLMLARTDNLATRVRRLALGAVVAGAVYAGISASGRVEAVGGVANDNGRHALLHSAWSVLSRSPVFGLGGAKPDPSLAASLDAVGLGWSSSVHNFLLDAWLRGGLVAGVLALLLVAKTVWPAQSRGRLLGLVLLPFFMLGSELLFFGDSGAAILIALAFGVGLSGGRAAERGIGR